MTTLAFLLEEPSAKDILEQLVPNLVPPDVSLQFMVFQGKQDLEKRMVKRMRAWLRRDTFFVVLRDQDAGDCKVIKNRLKDLATQAEKPDALIRIACHSLESWILGDWHALAMSQEKPTLAAQAGKAKFRNPDALSDPVREIRRFIPTYQKRDGARRIGSLLDPESNSSRSFKVFCSGIQNLMGQAVSR